MAASFPAKTFPMMTKPRNPIYHCGTCELLAEAGYAMTLDGDEKFIIDIQVLAGGTTYRSLEEDLPDD